MRSHSIRAAADVTENRCREEDGEDSGFTIDSPSHRAAQACLSLRRELGLVQPPVCPAAIRTVDRVGNITYRAFPGACSIQLPVQPLETEVYAARARGVWWSSIGGLVNLARNE
jgi:hypothetical protein